MESKKEDYSVEEVKEADQEVVTFDSFEEIEDIVTASGKGTIICCIG